MTTCVGDNYYMSSVQYTIWNKIMCLKKEKKLADDSRWQSSIAALHRGLWCRRLRDRRRQYSCKNAHTSEPSSWPVKVSCHYRFLNKFIDSCTNIETNDTKITRPTGSPLQVNMITHGAQIKIGLWYYF